MVKVILSGDDEKSAIPLTPDNALAVLELVFGGEPGSISLVPVPEDPALAWQDRAETYDSQYKGPAHWVRYINVLAATGSSPFAAKRSGVTPAKANLKRERFPEFARACVDALEYYSSAVLEGAANQRAIDGVLEPVFHKGTIIGYVRKYSDVLLQRLLEGNNPEKYKTRTQVDGNVAHRLVVEGGLPEPDDGPKAIEHEPQKLIEGAACPDTSSSGTTDGGTA